MKNYNNEEIVVSLTSWKGRIATTYKTIDSLLKWCNYTHIVLVLAEEEFVNKEKDLPDSIMQYVENDKIELMWVNKNYITYKKSFFTAKKYPNSIIVTADDDKIYTEDFISELYAHWLTNKNAIVTYKSSVDLNFHYKNTCYQYGEAVLYPPNYYGDIAVWLMSQNDIFDIINKYPNDDYFHTALRSALHKNDFIVINRNHAEIALNHDEGEVITKNRRTLNFDKNSEEYKNIKKNIEEEQYKVEEEIVNYINNKIRRIYRV